MNPAAYCHKNGLPTSAKMPEEECFWQTRTISDILEQPAYLGHTVNFKTQKKSYKSKKKVKNDPSEWAVFENTHEAIIDQETFDTVQRIRDGKRRITPMGKMPVLSGMVFCADCGAKLYQVRGHNLPQKEYMVCATYRKKGKNVCTSHQIQNEDLEKLILLHIRGMMKFAAEHEDEFLAMVTKAKTKAVEKVYVHQTEKVNGVKTRRIRILFNYIGEFELPMA